MGTWREQWRHVQIGLQRIEQLTNGRSPSEGTPGASFDVYGFFLNCYHLCHWITHDDTLNESTRKGAKDFARNDPTLSICADIANGSKHSSLDWAHTGDVETGPSTISLVITPGDSASYDFVMQLGGMTRRALDLATECIEA